MRDLGEFMWCSICGYANNTIKQIGGIEYAEQDMGTDWRIFNRLRSENITRGTSVEIPGYKDTQQELEAMREKCEKTLHSLPDEDQQMILEWMAKLEDMNSLEGQKAYCQGYVDCILLLSGLGLFRQEISPEKLMKLIER